MARKLLIVEDDEHISELLTLYLEREGFETVIAADGEEALAKFKTFAPDLVLLDIMIPKLDGWGGLSEIRAEAKTPVIMLTAKGDTGERVRGLELGADDYIAKPFDSNELIARIKAVLRRSVPAADQEKAIVLPDLSISLENYSVVLDGIQLEMPPKEIELLYFLASHAGKVFTREQLLEQVWGFDFFGDSRTVDVHVKRIREKLGERQSWQLKTVWGVGYKFEIHS